MRRVISVVAVVFLIGGFGVQAEDKGLDLGPVGPGTAPEATGGPDAFGYTWADQLDGCTFQWVDISGTGTNLGTGDDSAFPVTLGIGGVDFYGTVYTDLQVATNGYISTDPTDTGPDTSNDCPLPAAPSTGGGARLYAVHDDLDVDPLCTDCAVFHEYFAICPRPNDLGSVTATGCDVIQWQAQHYPGAAGTASEFFQVIVYETRDLVMQVEGATEGGGASTTGIQNDGATIGLTYACDTTSSIDTGTAVCFAHPNPVPVELMSFDVE